MKWDWTKASCMECPESYEDARAKYSYTAEGCRPRCPELQWDFDKCTE